MYIYIDKLILFLYVYSDCERVNSKAQLFLSFFHLYTDKSFTVSELLGGHELSRQSSGFKKKLTAISFLFILPLDNKPKSESYFNKN